MKPESASKSPYLDPRVQERLANLHLVARQAVEGVRVGMHKSPLRGFSTEFAQHRQYVPGDETRHLDWRVYARTGRYYLKQHIAETNFTAHMLLDASRSMHYGSGKLSKLEYAKYMLVSLAYLILEQRDSVGLAVFDAELRRFIEPSGRLNIVRTWGEELLKVQPLPRTNVAALLHEFANRIRRRGFVILFSDLFDHVDEFLEGLDHLRFRGHNVIVFHVLDPYELDFPFDGSVKFVGLEDDGEIVTLPKRVKMSYLTELRRFLVNVRTGCDKRRVDYVLVNTARPIDAVLAGFLNARRQIRLR